MKLSPTLLRHVKIGICAGALVLSLALSVSFAAQPTLTFAKWGGSQSENTWWEEQVETFASTHLVPVEYLSVPNNQYNDWLITMMAAGRTPDLFMVRFSDYPTWALQGYLLDVTRMVEADEELQRVMFPGDSQSVPVEGSWYGLRSHYAFAHTYYSRIVFNEVGLAPMPLDGDHPWSWETFVSALQKITRRNPDGSIERYGASVANHWLRLGSLYATWGVELVGSDGFNIGGPHAIRATEAILDLYNRSLFPPRTTLSGGRANLVNGRTGILMDIAGGPHSQLRIDGTDDSWYGVAAYPAGEGQASSTSYMFGENIAIASGTQSPNEAYQLLRHLAIASWELDSPTPFLYKGRTHDLHPQEEDLARLYAYKNVTVVQPGVGFDDALKLIHPAWREVFSGSAPPSQLTEVQGRVDILIQDLKDRIDGKESDGA